MSGAAREKDQADFDLERFVNMFDEAMTSSDPRVIDALRSLMMIVTLTRPESRSNLEDRRSGPLRRLFEDMNDLNRRMHRLEEDVNQTIHQQQAKWPLDEDIYRWHEKDMYAKTAAAQVAQKIDQDVINQIKNRAKGLYKK